MEAGGRHGAEVQQGWTGGTEGGGSGGDLVACLDPCSGSWRRARVLGLLDNCRVEVMLLDYGGVVALEKAFLWNLEQDFRGLVAQAVAARGRAEVGEVVVV